MITLPASCRRRRGKLVKDYGYSRSLNSLYEWFSGFCDAESSFYFRVRSNLVEFEFKIGLHKDDLAVFFIQKLGIKKASFRVGKYNELLFLLEIFEKFPLILLNILII